MTSSKPVDSGITDLTGAQVVIDLGALVSNWKFLQSQFSGKICGAVVKANAYGIGVKPAVSELYSAGCRYFFVALPEEGEIVRTCAPNATIIVLNGLLPNQCKYYHSYKLIPSLNSEEEFYEWMSFKSEFPNEDPIVLHFDTGINRLGMQLNSLKKIAENFPVNLKNNSLILMTHLACADAPQDPKNNEQLANFNEYKKLFPNAVASMCNSAGIFLGPDFHFDIARPGIALYGAKSITNEPCHTLPIASLYAKVLQIRSVPSEETIGYGATYKVKKQSRIATIACGYADGFIRNINSKSNKHQPCVYIKEFRVPIVGRISMDQIQVDVTDIPESLCHRNTVVEFFGKNISVDEIAQWADTIPNEVLTGLSPRVTRKYLHSNSELNE